jgi:hypothetical protein
MMPALVDPAKSPLPRLYKPFRDVHAKPTRRELINLLRRIYGPGIPWFMGSAYEGHALNDAELILHELAHMTQFDFGKRIPVGAMEPTWKMIFDRTEAMAEDDADDHEVHAITVELLTSEALGLPLSPSPAHQRRDSELRQPEGRDGV